MLLAPNNSELVAQNILSTVVSIPSVALGILVGTLALRCVRIARQKRRFSEDSFENVRPEPDHAGPSSRSRSPAPPPDRRSDWDLLGRSRRCRDGRRHVAGAWGVPSRRRRISERLVRAWPSKLFSEDVAEGGIVTSSWLVAHGGRPRRLALWRSARLVEDESVKDVVGRDREPLLDARLLGVGEA